MLESFDISQLFTDLQRRIQGDFKLRSQHQYYKVGRGFHAHCNCVCLSKTKEGEFVCLFGFCSFVCFLFIFPLKNFSLIWRCRHRRRILYPTALTRKTILKEIMRFQVMSYKIIHQVKKYGYMTALNCFCVSNIFSSHGDILYYKECISSQY